MLKRVLAVHDSFDHMLRKYYQILEMIIILLGYSVILNPQNISR